MIYPLWILIFTIGVYDASQHRIPNVLIIGIFAFYSIELISQDDYISDLIDSSGAAVLVFCLALFCHVMGWMAPGDVKLLSAIGFLSGFGDLTTNFFWIGIATTLIGGMYWFVNHLRIHMKPISLTSMFKLLCYSPLSFQNSSQINSSIYKTQDSVMPFAPVVVCGLALAQYFN